MSYKVSRTKSTIIVEVDDDSTPHLRVSRVAKHKTKAAPRKRRIKDRGDCDLLPFPIRSVSDALAVFDFI